MGRLEIITTGDGSNTLFIPEMNEQFHSVNGAFTEARHVFLKNGFSFIGNREMIRLLEIGFGTGLNCLLTTIEATSICQKITYVGVEKEPLPDELLFRLNYSSLLGGEAGLLFERIHNAQWGKVCRINNWVELKKVKSDVVDDEIPDTGLFDLVYFDAFGPEKQPGLWDYNVLGKVSESLRKGGVWVTYSAKGEVRRKMQELGFAMERLQGPPGKREMLRGIKK